MSLRVYQGVPKGWVDHVGPAHRAHRHESGGMGAVWPPLVYSPTRIDCRHLPPQGPIVTAMRVLRLGGGDVFFQRSVRHDLMLR
jgi:hypothetical protein